MKYGLPSIADKMRHTIKEFEQGDIKGDVYGLLEAVERCFPHWTTDIILSYTARYLREVGDTDTADSIIEAKT